MSTAAKRLLLLDVVGPDARARRRRDAEPRAPRARGIARAARVPVPRADVLVRRPRCSRASRPASTASSATAGTSARLQEIALWSQSHALLAGRGRPRARAARGAGMRRSRGYSSGTRWARRRRGASRRARSTRRTAGRSPTSGPIRPSSARELQERLGTFPLFEFWGPGAGLESSRWILAAAEDVWRRQAPTLLSVYVPHLDYDFQRFGPDDPRSRRALREVDAAVGPLIDRARGRRRVRHRVLRVRDRAASTRRCTRTAILREAGLLEVRDEGGGELLDPVRLVARSRSPITRSPTST